MIWRKALAIENDFYYTFYHWVVFIGMDDWSVQKALFMLQDGHCRSPVFKTRLHSAQPPSDSALSPRIFIFTALLNFADPSPLILQALSCPPSMFTMLDFARLFGNLQTCNWFAVFQLGYLLLVVPQSDLLLPKYLGNPGKRNHPSYYNFFRSKCFEAPINWSVPIYLEPLCNSPRFFNILLSLV